MRARRREAVKGATLVPILGLAMLVACGTTRHRAGVPAPSPTCATPSRGGAAPTNVAAPDEGVSDLAREGGDERFYPGRDFARTDPRRRYRSAVLLFAPPRAGSVEALEEIETLSFQPIVCVIDGKLATGERCGAAMPPKVTVRLTDASSAYDTMEVMRSTVPFTARTDEGDVTFRAPYAPSCCMYHRCVGRTIPYRPVASPGAALATSRTILAVWPADAELDLRPRSTDAGMPQVHAWSLSRLGARRLLEIASTDVDHDGHAERLVYEVWANDYGIDVLVDGIAAPIFAFSCGNI